MKGRKSRKGMFWRAAGRLVLVLLLAGAGRLAAAPEEKEGAKQPQGFFTLKREKGTWWLLNPSGEHFFSMGVNGVNMGVSQKRYDPAIREYCALRFHASEEAWRKAAGERLAGWGFNTLGEGADEGLRGQFPYVVNLRLGTSVGAPWKDPASPEARARYAELLAPVRELKNDRNLVGYLLDGAAGWWDEGLFLHILKQDSAEEAMKLELMRLLRSEYGKDVSLFGEDFEVVPQPEAFDGLQGALRRASFRSGRRPLIVEEFLGWVAERYYRTLTEEIRKLDPQHLIFSDCHTAFYSQPVVMKAGKYVDAICVNCDSVAPQGWASPAYFETLSELTGKPVLVGEFYFAAGENSSGNPNRNGVYMTVKTQAERAEGAAALAGQLARFPGVVGYHWYQYYDQPPGARGKQNFNLGLVDVKDEPYEALGRALAKANEESLERRGTWPVGFGMQRSSQGWRVSRMPAALKADGELGEWDLAKAWIPAARAAAPFERFGDIYLAWHAEGMALAVVYSDYRYTRAGAAAPAEDTERLTLGLAIEDEDPLGFTLQGIQVAQDVDAPEKGFHSPQVIATRGTVTFPAEGRFSMGQSAHGVQRIVEVFLPAALFKREALEPGLKMQAAVSLRLRAGFREAFWPRSFRRTNYSDARRWAPLVLER